MMRENKVAAAAVEVKGIAEVLMAHGRAFDVPARTAFAPRAVPCRFARFSTLPEGKVHGIMFAVVDFDAGAGFHVIEAAAAQFTVVVKFFDTVIDVIVDDVGIALIAGITVSPTDMELIHDVEVGRNVAVGNRIPADAFPVGGVDDLVVDVGEILDMRDFVAEVFQVALDDVPGYEGTGIPHVGMVIRRNATDIHFDLARRDGNEGLLFTSQRIVYFQFSHTVTPLKIKPKKPPSLMTETVARGSTLFLRHSRNLYCAVTGAPGPDYSIHPACSQRQRCSLMT